MDAKYLGVTLSNDLEWSKHIATMTNKANSKLSFLRRTLTGCPEKLKQTAYFSLIRSFIHLHLRVYGCIRGTMPVRTHIHFRSSNGLIEI